MTDRRCLTPEEYAFVEEVLDPEENISVSDTPQLTAAQPMAGPTTGVYFLSSSGFIKIGLARCVVQRLRGLRLASGAPIKPLGFIPVPRSYWHARQREAELHARFAVQRHHGEWFTESLELAQFIAEHAEPWPM
jgi:hypothetical protein